MYNLPEDIIEYIYKILHKELLIKTLKELKNKFIKWEPHLIKRFKLH
jgi:hypothetical protein